MLQLLQLKHPDAAYILGIKMKTNKIKVGFEQQAKKPVYLYKNGDVQCGAFRYRPGKLREKFKEIFEIIWRLTIDLEWENEIDVSSFKAWNACKIYEEFILKNWAANIPAKTVEKLALETEVHLTLEMVRTEFKKSVYRKFKRERKLYDFYDNRFPHHGWQVLIEPDQRNISGEGL